MGLERVERSAKVRGQRPGHMNAYSTKRGGHPAKEHHDSGVPEAGELEGLVG